MINTDRIVPIAACDLLSMYGLIIKQSVSGLTALDASAPGEFALTSYSAPVIADEPLKALDIDDSITAAVIYFVADYDYEGFTVDGAAVTVTGEVSADGVSLYSATLAEGAITIAKLGF